MVLDLGRSKRLRLGEGTIVPVDEAEDAEEESLGEVWRRSLTSSWSSSRSSKMGCGGSGGRRERWVFANDFCRSLIFKRGWSTDLFTRDTKLATLNREIDEVPCQTRHGRSLAASEADLKRLGGISDRDPSPKMTPKILQLSTIEDDSQVPPHPPPDVLKTSGK